MIQELDLSPQGLHSLQSVLVPQPLRLFLRDKDKIMSQDLATFFHSICLRCFSINGIKIDNE
jgi:hypothetical protein